MLPIRTTRCAVSARRSAAELRYKINTKKCIERNWSSSVKIETWIIRAPTSAWSAVSFALHNRSPICVFHCNVLLFNVSIKRTEMGCALPSCIHYACLTANLAPSAGHIIPWRGCHTVTICEVDPLTTQNIGQNGTRSWRDLLWTCTSCKGRVGNVIELEGFPSLSRVCHVHAEMPTRI